MEVDGMNGDQEFNELPWVDGASVSFSECGVLVWTFYPMGQCSCTKGQIGALYEAYKRVAKYMQEVGE